MRSEQPRAKDRGTWPGRRRRLSDAPDDDLSDVTTPAERLAMMWPLTRRAWALSGRAVPDYSRTEAPGRLSRIGVDDGS
jgi:hypothetical protein